MIVSYNWLKELVEIPYSPDQLSLALTSQGMTVDGVEKVGFPYNNIVVGEIIEVAKHPDADKLSVLKVNVATETLQIVCGAPNLEVGQKVPVAKIGAVLEDFKIKKSKLRGVESFGMCCGADELLISDDHSSLLFLDPATVVGSDFEDIMVGEDYLFDLDIPGNRPDLLCHIGVAREIQAHFSFKAGKGIAFENPKVELNESDKNVADFVEVEVKDSQLCPRYSARVIENVSTAPSPIWMQARLHRLGMRPINNIVDITNYVLLEYGQPLHAFDYEKVSNGKLIVRRATEKEVMTTLDDIERTLTSEMLVIADETKPLALAGVMGGDFSAVNDQSSTILLESANFDGPNIRKTSRQLNLQSESSFRFERTVRGCADEASQRAAKLLCKYAGGSVLKGSLDVDNGGGPVSFKVDYKRCIGLLGLKTERQQLLLALKVLGYQIEDAGKEDFIVTVPAYRIDVSENPDISEELARMVGYDKIPMNTDINYRSSKKMSPILLLRNEIRQILSGIGMTEAYNPSLISLELLSNVDIQEDSAEMKAIALANASTKEQSVMRTLLYPGLIRNAQHNFSHGASSVMLFEIGRKYIAPASGRDYQEKEILAFILAGNVEEGSWCSKEAQADFYDGKTVLQHLLTELNIKDLVSTASKFDGCHPGRTAKLSLKTDAQDVELGLLAELDPRLIRKLGLTGRVVIGEIEIEKLLSKEGQAIKFKALPKYPISTRDIALFVSEKHSHQEIKDLILSAKIDKLESVEVFDLYQGEQVPEGYKSMAYRIVYRDLNETLTDDVVDGLHKKVLCKLQDNLDVKTR